METSNTLTISRFELTNGKVRFYVNDINRQRLYLFINEEGKLKWSSQHNCRSGKTSADYAAIKKDEFAIKMDVWPWLRQLTGKSWSEITINDLEEIAR